MDEAVQEMVGRWLEKANHDLRACHAALKDDPPLTDIACFHAQQAVEKSLKAYLVSVGEHLMKSHDIEELLQICIRHNPKFDPLQDSVGHFTYYAVASRYPDDIREFTLDEAQEATRRAETVLGMVVKITGVRA